MHLAQAFNGGCFFIHLGVVLHRARTEWVKDRVDRVVHLAKVRVMTHKIQFADFRQVELLAGVAFGQLHLRDAQFRQSECFPSRRRDFKN